MKIMNKKATLIGIVFGSEFKNLIPNQVVEIDDADYKKMKVQNKAFLNHFIEKGDIVIIEDVKEVKKRVSKKTIEKKED